MNVTTQDFAAAVAKLEDQLGRMPNETELSDELRWTDSQAALIALGQQSEAVGLVKVVYTRKYERHYTCDTG
jgi:DNA-directed RNA polymerase specialized sigma subunit